MVRPIPKKVLIHTCSYEEYIPGDGFETEEGFEESITLNNVRIESVSNIKRNNNGEELQYKALLFFDVVSSSSSGTFEFKEKSKITFNGQTMHVIKVNPVYAFSLHHYEVELV